MMSGEGNSSVVGALDRIKPQWMHKVDVYEFVVGGGHGEEQCLEVLWPMTVCLSVHDETVHVSRNEEVRELNFSHDEDWHQVEARTGGGSSVVEKCVWAFEAKVCVQCQDRSEFTLL